MPVSQLETEESWGHGLPLGDSIEEWKLVCWHHFVDFGWIHSQDIAEDLRAALSSKKFRDSVRK